MDPSSLNDPMNNGNKNDLTQGLLSGGGGYGNDHLSGTNVPPASAFVVDEEHQVIFDETVYNDDLHNQQQQQQQQMMSGVGGEKQPNHFRDAWAAVLFLGHHVAIFYLAFNFGVPSLNYEEATTTTHYYGGGISEESTSSSSSFHFGGLFWLTLTATLGALVISALALQIMLSFAEFLIQFSLLFTVFCNAMLVIFMLAQGPYWYGACLALLFLIISAGYAKCVWRRVPFAAANLKTAITAVKLNGGIMIAAYGATIAMAVWSVVWLLAVMGVFVRPQPGCSASDTNQNDSSSCLYGNDNSSLVGLALLLSYYWTAEVTKNVIHVTTAGVVGTWWFAPEDAGRFCSPAITDSLSRATTFSLGSICFGSLVSALVQLLHRLVYRARRNAASSVSCNAIVLCVLDCLLDFLERIVSYFNVYAFCYVGLYGYDYLSAGRKVYDLFAERGWTTIINDQLVRRALLLVSLVMGAMTGCLGMLLASMQPSWMESFGDTAIAVAFIIPFLMGTATAVILTSVVSSAVDTIIVAFAEAPLEFERNHPGLYTHMVTCWRQVYPDEFGM